MIIALDYDETYTADPELWYWFVKRAKDRGHKVYVVTMRFPDEVDEIKVCLGNVVDKIIPTSHRFKLNYLVGLGIIVDIWIDDCPSYITGFDPNEQ